MRLSRLLRTCCLVLASLAAVGCTEEGEPATIERAEFVDAYVELRTAALQRGMAALDGPLRDTVLRAIGVTEDELVTFAEVHGDDLDFMIEVWADVSLQLDSTTFRPLDADSAAAR